MSNRQDDALPVVAWMESWPEDRIRTAGCRVFTEPPATVDWNDYDELVRKADAQSAIASLQARLDAAEKVPAGWKLVPTEPTEEMLASAHASDRTYTLRNFGDVMTVQQGPWDHYVAMLAAAPEAP